MYIKSLRHFAFFTQWDLYLTLTSMILNILCTRKHYNDQSRVEGLEFKMWRYGVLIFELAITMQTMTFFFSIFSHLFTDFKQEGFEMIILVLKHFLPLPMLVGDFYMQKWLFRSYHIIPILCVISINWNVNYLATIYYKKPLYPVIMEWDPVWTSMLVCFTSLVIFYYIFKFYKNITEKQYIKSTTNQTNKLHGNEIVFDRDGVQFAKLDEKEIIVDNKEKDI